jgi:GNAT superfamily N-acetyltransferase
MPAEAFTLRAATAQDLLFLTDVLVMAVNWCPSRDLARAEILSRHDLVHYINGWPRPTDCGMIAENETWPIGAAWLRLFSASDPGYGFVAPDVPELTIGVVPDWRGRGVGRGLLGAVEQTARMCGYPDVSLSVERANDARMLYLSAGFRVVHSGTDSDTMLKHVGGLSYVDR